MQVRQQESKCLWEPKASGMLVAQGLTEGAGAAPDGLLRMLSASHAVCAFAEGRVSGV